MGNGAWKAGRAFLDKVKFELLNGCILVSINSLFRDGKLKKLATRQYEKVHRSR